MDAATDRVIVSTLELAEQIGPRRPGSAGERRAAEWLCDRLGGAGVRAELERFPVASTFAAVQGSVLALGLLAGYAGRRSTRVVVGAGAVALGALEDGLVTRPVQRAVGRRASQNVVATIEPRGEPRRTLCLVSHLDSSRSGLLFSSAVTPHLRTMIGATSAALALRPLAALVGVRRLERATGVALAASLALLAERELRGVDVPGANDNASGVALVLELAAERASAPLDHTRLVVLATGGEEAGTFGADAFLRGRDTRGWLFVNFDGVCAPATLRYLPREGVVRTWPADPGLLAVAERIERDRSELGLRRMRAPAGLTYDATPVLARSGRALTISAQDGTIPNYHQPTDDRRNVDPDTVSRALGIGRALVAAVDSGEADG